MRQASNGALASASIRILAAAGAVLSLAACQPAGSSDVAPRTGPATFGVPLLETDIETPDVFSVTDRGLWDGRPSLGGVWVAAPGVTTPERVLIRVPETGKSVVGALFRREREFAGPPLQISSEAATALGIYAGAPTEVAVVALRRAEAPDISAALPPPPEATPALGPAAAEPSATEVSASGVAAPATPRRGNFLRRLFGPAAATDTIPIPAGTAVPEAVDTSASNASD